jgi:GNAT superfamily N-acetyltransferase
MDPSEESGCSVLIRSPSRGDLSGLSALLGELGYPASVSSVETRLGRIARQSNVAVFVAERGRALVGLATGHMLAVIHADDPIAILSALIVADGHRGRGIGRSLVDAVESWAKGRGAGRITVASGLARAGAHSFYERLGYEYTARRYSKVIGNLSE